MIGIEIEYEFNYGNILQKLFENVNYKSYEWCIIQQEIITKENNLYLSESTTDRNLESLIKSDEEYLIVELNIQVYKKGTSKSIIKTYDDFIKSHCEMIVLICDCDYLEVYFKDDELKKRILSNLESMGITYEKKIAGLDSRTIMKV